MMREQHMMDPRRAGLVERYHTWPHLKVQSVAEHTWQLFRILWAIWPEVPRHVLQHALVHDLGELRRGDMPYPGKMEMSPTWRAEEARAERDAILSMCLPWGLPPPPQLTDPEARTFKLAEYIEMEECGLFEVNLGNRYASLVVERCRDMLDLTLTELPDTYPDGVRSRAVDYLIKRRREEEEVACPT